MSVCQADSGSMTDCRPICDRLAVFRVSWDGYGGSYSAAVCAGHVAYFRARVYPYQLNVESLNPN